MRVGYFDCFSGIAGDMTLAALVDAGVDRRAIQEAVASLGLPCELTFETVRRGGFRATYAKVATPHEHAHRHWHHIEAIIDKSILTPRQKDLAKRIFLKLGEAEAKVHGIDLAKIHFHEVGAVDSIVDIVGSAVGLDLLGVDRFEASPVPPGRGWVKAAHGRMPLPAPATAELLRGVPLAESMVDGEMTTPTGAAILTTVVERFASLPALTIESIGLGAGTREVPEQANILRLFVGTVNLPAASDRVWVLETNLDDLPGEVVGYTMTRLHGSRRPRRLRHADPDEEEPARRDGLGPLRRGQDPRARRPALPGDRDPGHSPLPGQPAQAEAAAHRGRDAVRRDPREARLAGGAAADVQPRIRRLRADRRGQAIPLREVYDAAHAAYARASQASPSASSRAYTPLDKTETDQPRLLRRSLGPTRKKSVTRARSKEGPDPCRRNPGSS